MQVRPFVLLGASALDAVRQMLDGVVGAWCAEWGLARDEAGVSCQRAWDAGRDAPSWQQQGADGALWLGWPPEFLEQLQKVLFAPDRHLPSAAGQASIAAEGAAAAWTDLRRQLMSLCAPAGPASGVAPGAAPAARHWQPGSGSVLLTLRIGKHRCTGLLDLPAVRALVQQARLRGLLAGEPPLPALPALDYRQALAAVPVRLPVTLGHARVGFGSLLALAPGDVIRLDRAADRPVAVTNPAGERWFDGCLGTIGASLGLEVVKPVA